MKRITLTQGMAAIIDDDDYELVRHYRWRVKKGRNTHYALTSIQNSNKKDSTMFMHRLILQLSPEDEQQCDHIDGDGLNNQKKNLRIVTCQQNHFNRQSHSNTSSRFKGVSWHKSRNKYEAKIYVNKRNISLGQFDDETQAARMYDRVAIAERGEFARTNFPAQDYVNQKLPPAIQFLEQRKQAQSSTFQGVYWQDNAQKWRAQIYVDNKRIYLGLFKKEKDAAEAVRCARNQNKLLKKETA